MPKIFIFFIVLFCASHPRLLAQCEHIIQPTQKEIDEGYAQMSSAFIRIVLSVFFEDKSPLINRAAGKKVSLRFVDHERLTKPGDFFGTKLLHDTPPCWEGTLPAKKRIAKRILQEANKLGAFYIDSRNERKMLDKIKVNKPSDQGNFWAPPFDFTYLILAIPRKGGPYSPGMYIDEKEAFPDAWSMRVTKVTRGSIFYYDITLQEISPKTWVLVHARGLYGYMFDF